MVLLKPWEKIALFAAFVFEFCDFILTNPIHCRNRELQASTESNEKERGIWERGGGGGEFGLTEMCFPFLAFGDKNKLKVILKQHYRIIMAATVENIFLY